MSLQRVFESARKMGVPVIVTDPAGRDPMVILPLEQFEAMAGESHVPTRESGSRGRDADRNVGIESRKSKVTSPETMPYDLRPTPSEIEIPLNQAKNIGEDIPLEDRFFIEPLEDESGM